MSVMMPETVTAGELFIQLMADFEESEACEASCDAEAKNLLSMSCGSTWKFCDTHTQIEVRALKRMFTKGHFVTCTKCNHEFKSYEEIELIVAPLK